MHTYPCSGGPAVAEGLAGGIASFVFASPAAGSSFPSAPFAFAVHSIFRSALNLKISADTPLVSLFADSRYAHPLGAAVPGARFDEWSLERGDYGSFDGDLLSFSAPGAPRVRVEAARRDAEERAPEIPDSDGLLRALDRAARLVVAARRERGILPIFLGTELDSVGDLFAPSLRASAARLLIAFEERSLPAALRATEKFTGLGPGLTPAGDDFLCGFLAARRSRIGDEEDRNFLEEFGRAAAPLFGRTNEISAAFLWSAAGGRFSSALVGLADALRSEVRRTGMSDPSAADALAAAVFTLSSLGHSSGLDAAEGFLCGLSMEDRNHHGEQA